MFAKVALRYLLGPEIPSIDVSGNWIKGSKIPGCPASILRTSNGGLAICDLRYHTKRCPLDSSYRSWAVPWQSPCGQCVATPMNPAKAVTLMRASIHCISPQIAASKLVPECLGCMFVVTTTDGRPGYSAGSFRSSCSSRTRCAMLVLSSCLGGGGGSSSRCRRLSHLKITGVPSIEWITPPTQCP